MLLQIADIHTAQGRAFRIRAGIIPLLIIVEAIACVRLAVASALLGEPGDLPCDVRGNRQFMQCRSVRLAITAPLAQMTRLAHPMRFANPAMLQ